MLSLSPFCPYVYSQGQGQYAVTMPYEAPIRPGMPAWRNVPASEHLKVLDIPVAVATNMTRWNLLRGSLLSSTCC
jgi:hypothetical protein